MLFALAELAGCDWLGPPCPIGAPITDADLASAPEAIGVSANEARTTFFGDYEGTIASGEDVQLSIAPGVRADRWLSTCDAPRGRRFGYALAAVASLRVGDRIATRGTPAFVEVLGPETAQLDLEWPMAEVLGTPLTFDADRWDEVRLRATMGTENAGWFALVSWTAERCEEGCGSGSDTGDRRQTFVEEVAAVHLARVAPALE
jgi:hypothetical protein